MTYEVNRKEYYGIEYGAISYLEEEGTRLREIIRVLVHANETDAGAVGLVQSALGREHAELLVAVLADE